MKKSSQTLLFTLLFVPSIIFAQSIQEQYISSLRQIINLLQQQVVLLVQQLNALQSNPPPTPVPSTDISPVVIPPPPSEIIASSPTDVPVIHTVIPTPPPPPIIYPDLRVTCDTIFSYEKDVLGNTEAGTVTGTVIAHPSGGDGNYSYHWEGQTPYPPPPDSTLTHLPREKLEPLLCKSNGYSDDKGITITSATAPCWGNLSSVTIGAFPNEMVSDWQIDTMIPDYATGTVSPDDNTGHAVPKYILPITTNDPKYPTGIKWIFRDVNQFIHDKFAGGLEDVWVKSNGQIKVASCTI